MMDIATLKTIDLGYARGTYQSSGSGADKSNVNTNPVVAEVVSGSGRTTDNTDNTDNSQLKGTLNKIDQNLSKENLDNLTAALNKFMQSVNADIHFKLHEGTKEYMVQVVDDKTQAVLREFPPHRLLDTVAAIRDRIGMLLDLKI